MPKTAPAADPLQALQKKINRFVAERDWEQFHTPKNLAMALSVEAAELMEIFQWLDGSAAVADLPSRTREAVADEVADILVYLLRFCAVAGIDPLAAARAKLKKNALKYPVRLVKGKSAKYTEY
jgi:NTP pyrophosphatase (non-canonical NTP hydrolase)